MARYFIKKMFKLKQRQRQFKIRRLESKLMLIRDLRSTDINEYIFIDEDGNLDIDRRSLDSDVEELYQQEFERFVERKLYD